MTNLEKRVHVDKESRTQLSAELKAQYEQGASIRELMKTTGRSYGFVHQVLTEAHVSLRGRGRPYSAKSSPTAE